MYLGLVWDTCKLHAKCQDTCILLECNRAFKIHLRYIKIHVHSGCTCILQDTRMIHQDTIGYVSYRTPPQSIGNPTFPESMGESPHAVMGGSTVTSSGVEVRGRSSPHRFPPGGPSAPPPRLLLACPLVPYSCSPHVPDPLSQKTSSFG